MLNAPSQAAKHSPPSVSNESKKKSEQRTQELHRKTTQNAALALDASRHQRQSQCQCHSSGRGGGIPRAICAPAVQAHEALALVNDRAPDQSKHSQVGWGSMAFDSAWCRLEFQSSSSSREIKSQCFVVTRDSN